MIDEFSHGFINSVYKFNDFTLNELICKLAQKMDEVITKSNESFNYLDWLKGQGLSDEVIKIMLEWKENGTLETVINDALLQNINEQFDTFKTEVSEQLDKITKNRSMQKIIQKMIDKEIVNIVCYGDSVTYGFIPNDGKKTVNPYPETLQYLLREYYGYGDIYVYNEGYSGRQSDELASDEYINHVKKHTPDLVILMVGLNDKLGNYGDISSIEFYMNNLKTIKNKLAEYELMLLTPTPNYSGNGSSY